LIIGKDFKMAKRFTDTNKYKKPFIRSLKGAYKLLWDYLYHDCDHAGIWIVDFEIAQIYIGADMPVNRKDALKYFNDGEVRIIEFENDKWFIPSFIDFQYGELSENNRAHNSVINILKKNNLYNNKGLIRGLQDPKDKDKDIDKDKNMEKEKTNFEIILDEWFDYKKKRGQSYKSEKSKQLLATKLKELSGGDDLKARKIIEQSMLNNWAGIFQLKTDKPTHAITDYQQQNSNIDKW